ncbi:GerAB/ArcD/ProY family transporter [Paenibacillus sacheonensis]|uniref:Endospore germination permease n=1 Tax=Paenibacillus sacheonensis TaxID=742054 RepID=A0A7X4YVS1_9BACL|nr:endospore germination permease [Paenibacillus sacheonensis]MBM7564335.1 spore germination protein KB [Paenibacillus sacheonensis]NBC73435.1 endospore germination permease [Paenibacillus sacheonensis]
MAKTITANQAALLLFVFMTSSSIINIPGPTIQFAGNAAWISILISAAIGMLTVLPVIMLAKRHPGQNFIEYSRNVVGAPITILFGLLFLYYQTHMASAIVLDIAMFLNSSVMRNTPSYWFILLSFLVAALSVRTGIDKMTGLFPVLMASVMLFVVLVTLLSISNYSFGNLLPVLPNGAKPLLQGVYTTYGFPYCEVVLFSMILCYVKAFGKRFEFKALQAVLANALSLSGATVVTILVFGPIAGDRKYSLFEVARTVNIIDVFSRMEALIGYSLILASFMKTTIVLFTAHQTLMHLLKLKQDRMLIFPLALFMAAISLAAATRGETKWHYEVSAIHPLWGFSFALLPLLIVFAVDLMRGKKDDAQPPQAANGQANKEQGDSGQASKAPSNAKQSDTQQSSTEQSDAQPSSTEQSDAQPSNASQGNSPQANASLSNSMQAPQANAPQGNSSKA